MCACIAAYYNNYSETILYLLIIADVKNPSSSPNSSVKVNINCSPCIIVMGRGLVQTYRVPILLYIRSCHRVTGQYEPYFPQL